ncbi:MAG TPA: HAD family hydrolase [Nitrospirota bacterium]|nr:HAD family hydrolase [Nitrospirota bacterium]
MRPKNLVIDCDDTLWENNRYFLEAHSKFVELMGSLGYDPAEADELLLRLEMENVPRYGYGAKSQAMSMADVYMILEPRPDEGALRAIEAMGEEVFNHPLTLMPGVEETLPRLSERYRLALYTKGNPDEQMGKLVRSPFKDCFHHVRVVPEKDRETFGSVLSELNFSPDETWMIGDSPRSDIMPAIAHGVRSVYIPCPTTWVHEHRALPPSERIITLERFDRLAGLLL